MVSTKDTLLSRWKSSSTKTDTTTPPLPTEDPQFTQPRIDNQLLYRYLRLEHFTEDEVDNTFDEIRKHDTTNGKTTPKAEEDEEGTRLDGEDIRITRTQLRGYLLERIKELEEENHMGSQRDEKETLQWRDRLANHEATRIFNGLVKNDDDEEEEEEEKTISRQDFRETLLQMASSVDYRRTIPITVSTLLMGSSFGIITPVMPFVVENLGLSPGQYGMVVGSFALARVVANVPSAILVERHGRKPYLVHSMSVLAMGVGGVGLATSFEHLVFCRLLVGLGVAALSTAGTMSLTDMSTARNRAQTMAPTMSSFAAGTALGPAIGGFLADKVGIQETFYLVGVSYLGLATINSYLLSETKSQPTVFPWQQEQQQDSKRKDKDDNESIGDAVSHALQQWTTLLANPRVRNVVIMNGFYWMSLAGAQMTLLPLMLTDSEGLNMTATGVGQVYMGMSLVQVLGNPIFARLVDTLGRAPAMLAGCTLISSSMATMPLATDLPQLAAVLGLWATGSSILSTAPVAYITDATEDHQRAQAIALLRTSGDVGFLLGASVTGALADWTGNLDVAMQTSAGALLTATAWFGFRKYVATQLQQQQQQENKRP